MALAVDGTSPARVTSNNSTTTATTASFTPPADSVLVACLSGNDDGTGTIASAFSSSPALTWTVRVERSRADTSGQSGFVAIATATAATSQAYTVTGSYSGSAATGPCSLKVYAVTGADTASPVGATGENSSTTNNITPAVYTSTVANSRAFGAATDWQALGLPASTDTEDPFHVTNQISGLAVYKAADTASVGSSVTLNFDAGGSSAAAWNWAAVEIKPAAGGGGTTHTGTASGGSSSTGAAAVTLRLAAAGAGASTTAGTAAGVLHLAATATGAASSAGTAAATISSGPVVHTAAAAGAASSDGTASVVLTLAATGSGASTSGGTAAGVIQSGPVTHDAAASGASVSAGTATISLTITGAAAGGATSAGDATPGMLLAALAAAAATSAGQALARIVGESVKATSTATVAGGTSTPALTAAAASTPTLTARRTSTPEVTRG